MYAEPAVPWTIVIFSSRVIFLSTWSTRLAIGADESTQGQAVPAAGFDGAALAEVVVAAAVRPTAATAVAAAARIRFRRVGWAEVTVDSSNSGDLSREQDIRVRLLGRQEV